MLKKLLILIGICLLPPLIFGVSVSAAAEKLNAAAENAAAYVYAVAPNPTIASVGGEWGVIGLARLDYDLPESYYDSYYQTAREYIQACGGNLHDRKYSEYSRVILALTAAGYDPRNVAGYDLTYALGDFEKTVWQGLNGPVFALIALDSGDYPVPLNKEAKTQATREMYLAEILKNQLEDGGFALSRNESATSADTDITAMALQALAKYRHKPEVKAAIDKALVYLSRIQDESGGFSARSMPNSESVIQVIIALGELGIAYDDSRFVKNSKSLADNLMTYFVSDSGFRHSAEYAHADLMASEQALCALASIRRAAKGENSLYNMSDAAKREEGSVSSGGNASGLPAKHKDIKTPPIIYPGKTFTDISGHQSLNAIEALASRGIINGKTAETFDPESAVSRSEFATIIIKAFGLPPKAVAVFSDVAPDSWYAPYTGSAYAYGIISGVTNLRFNPEGTINRQEAAVIISRAAGLAAMDNALSDSAARDILARFSDYTSAAEWARPSLAFCYRENILSAEATAIKPTERIKRYEAAEMVYNMLSGAKLL